MTAVLVIGTGHCGTSAVAGALCEMGVWMGERFGPSRRYPVYEDAEMAEVVEQVIEACVLDLPLAGNPFVPLVRARERRPLWGFKYPHLVWTLDWLLDILDDVRIVVVDRNEAGTIASCRRSCRLSQERAKAWYDCVCAAIERFVAGYPGAVLRVQYEELVEDPRREITRLAGFVFDGETVAEERLERAVELIRRPV